MWKQSGSFRVPSRTDACLSAQRCLAKAAILLSAGILLCCSALMVLCCACSPDYWYGTLKYSRMDFVANWIHRGRDLGLTTYNKAREFFNRSIATKWQDIHPNETVLCQRSCRGWGHR